MNNEFLYNKYKPLEIEEFVGQKDVIRIIKYLILNKNVPCNYIFYGPKGTGKTSFSRIFFKIINCSKNFNKKCSKKCLCKNKFPFEFDFLEIDAASNRKVEEIKEIVKFKDYIPIMYHYRMISIDEAHMLSNYSFNFLLKCIEESNKNFVIVFITTNLNKIPETIRSRCMCLRFKKISKNNIFKRIKYISEKEKIIFDEKSLKIISKNSEGSMRDALVNLEKIVALTNNNLSYKNTLKNIDFVDDFIIKKILKLIIDKNRKKIIDFIIFLKNKIKNFNNLIKNIFFYINKLVIDNFKFNKDIKKLLILRECFIKEFIISKKINEEQYENFFCVILKCFNKIND